ncbi:MAG: hypothetical protein V2I43_00120, partial [Parvularcula sp.]|nr:hypothetical protein [Parvularcula sp.]
MRLEPPPAPEMAIRAQSGDPKRFTAATTYNAAADDYDDHALGFWQRHGEAIVANLAPQPGQTIL